MLIAIIALVIGAALYVVNMVGVNINANYDSCDGYFCT